MAVLVIVALRLALGLLLGSSLAAAGYFAGSWLVPGHVISGLKIVLMVGAGVGASIGTGLSWASYLSERRASLWAASLAIAGAFLGAWGGYVYACAMYECVAVPKPTTVTTTVLTAALAANVLAGLPVSAWIMKHERY